jgi:phosphonate transport system substrate-binding protein
MIGRRAALFALLALAGCGRSGPPPPPPAPEALTFSIVSTENPRTQIQEWGPFLQDMQAAVGLPVKPFFGANYTAAVEAMRFRQADLGWFTNASGMEAVRRAGGEVFARTTNEGGHDGYQGVIVVRKGSGVTLDKLLACGRRYDFGMGDARSTSGTLAPMAYLFGPRAITPVRCFKTVRSANAEANLLAVGSGLLDAATDNTRSMDRMAVLDTAIARKTLANLEVIWRSPTIPEDPMVWRADLDPALKARIAKFIFSYGVGDTAEAKRQRKILARIQTGPFVKADNSHLIPVREIEAVGQLAMARTAGDKAAQAKAQAALDAVAREKAAAPAAAHP